MMPIDLDPICRNCGARLHSHVDSKLGQKCSATSTSYFPPLDIPRGWYAIVYRQAHANFYVWGGATIARMAGHEQMQHGSSDDVFFVPVSEAAWNRYLESEEGKDNAPIFFDDFLAARDVSHKTVRGFPSKRVTSVSAVGTRNQPKELFVIEYIPGDDRWYPLLQKDVPEEIPTNSNAELGERMAGIFKKLLTPDECKSIVRMLDPMENLLSYLRGESPDAKIAELRDFLKAAAATRPAGKENYDWVLSHLPERGDDELFDTWATAVIKQLVLSLAERGETLEASNTRSKRVRPELQRYRALKAALESGLIEIQATRSLNGQYITNPTSLDHWGDVLIETQKKS